MSEIDTTQVYKQLKKQNGEKFAQAMRGDRHHSVSLLDVPNIVHILEFAGNREHDAEILYPILREIYKPVKESEYYSNKDPIALLSDAGYNAFVVKTERQKNSIKKYFRDGEKLCTFGDDTRHKKYYIIHAIKRGADKIKPAEPPKREDEYGTSVISIQILKTGGRISIKNRYNHSVTNPDDTFNNNPDNIIPGLTNSLKKYFNVEFIATKKTLPDNFCIVGDQFVHFNYEIDNVYYDENHYFEDATIMKLNPDYELMLDTVILDTRTGKARSAHTSTEYLSNILNDEISGNKIKTGKDKTTGETIVNIIDENKNVKELLRTKNGCITSMHLYKTSELPDNFLIENVTLRELYANKLKKMGQRCFNKNPVLETLYIPELEEIGDFCFDKNIMLQEFNAPKLKKIGMLCFFQNTDIKQIYIPELEEIGNETFCYNEALTEFNAPKLKKMWGANFNFCSKLKKLYIPKLEEIFGEAFSQTSIEEFIAPKLKKMRPHCFHRTKLVLKQFYAPELEEITWDCFSNAKIIRNFYAPELKITDDTPEYIIRIIKLNRLKEGIKKTFGLLHQKQKRNTDVPVNDTSR